MHVEQAKKLADEKQLIDKILSFKEQGLPIPEELLPKEKPAKKKKEGDDKKKKK